MTKILVLISALLLPALLPTLAMASLVPTRANVVCKDFDGKTQFHTQLTVPFSVFSADVLMPAATFDPDEFATHVTAGLVSGYASVTVQSAVSQRFADPKTGLQTGEPSEFNLQLIYVKNGSDHLYVVTINQFLSVMNGDTQNVVMSRYSILKPGQKPDVTTGFSTLSGQIQGDTAVPTPVLCRLYN